MLWLSLLLLSAPVTARVQGLARGHGSHDAGPLAVLDPTSGGPYPPLLYLAGGCQGSMAVGGMARTLLTAHGFEVAEGALENFR